MAQGGGGGGQGQGGDNTYALVWGMGLLLVVSYVLWRYAHDHIVSIVFDINLYQAKLINFFIHSDKLTNDIHIMQTVDISKVDWGELVAITENIGTYMRYPVMVILVALSIYLYKSNITLGYKKSYSMGSLREQEQNVWPAIMPVVSQDLVSQDINQGPWAMALSPIEFSQKNDLLKKDDLILDAPILPGTGMTAGLKKGDAKRVFTLQLGAYWDGFEKLPPQTYALAAVFMARINRDRDGADAILKELDRSISVGKPNFAVATAVINKNKNTQLVQEVIAKHAYVLTVMASLLEAARCDGVVPSSEFLWLKTVDRRLWYMLNCIGRQTPYAEVAGAFAHWKAEKALGRKSIVPMIDEAIKALEIAIKEVKLKPQQLEALKP